MEPQQEPHEEKKSDFSLNAPVAILIAGVIIAGAILYIGNTGVPPQKIDFGVDKEKQDISLKAVTPNDHVLGDPNAPVVIIEFSDLECPFCKVFQGTMKKVIEKYGDAKQVAWVYRHFPLENLHTKARKEAEATECAGELGGTLAFWKYTDRLFEITPSNDRLDLSLLPKIATDIGLDKKKFEACLESGRYKALIDAHIEDAIKAGAEGTPFSVLLTKDGKTLPISGAQPYEDIERMIEEALEK